ncbi:WD domain, G-beta repeat containing protein [Entamoeba histolytica HM-1:IMSS-B]|uniref:WD domain containing protein n=6 Tax=Entamoeba histolytica TaxID=5759 RepID=C4LT18_ENTH1|nr:WD domain containing protein [Entamoeba histolytica HM-1:IMSS]EMD42825.1 WD domain containing protein [Entamoeba histolytica KU27]EMH73902.1 WD domain, G-beta repeat containing protein [Entamoeba histolytica HM-1:IMSS-B]EMS11803.1 WD domain, G-beta repeat-containing protein [Entamoeba histolytica HM-3:IMSS]ENY64334.1 WD domain, G-beta repeat-containing protein [Entamoeba histolytica HM-1:IMSS-A]GAT91686.1 WD domain containing protein [Entamoeba histolytica]|eukprot:XP_657491.1 WD domain containing protein [Entamoeba histolytica HM-1:IMSS]
MSTTVERRKSTQLMKKSSSEAKIHKSKSMVNIAKPVVMSKQAPGTFKEDKYDLKVTPSAQQQLNNFHKGMVWDYSFNIDGTLLATAGKDGKVMVWEIVDGLVKKEVKTTFTKHTGEIVSVIFIDNNIICSSSTTKELFIWNATNGEHIKTISIDDVCLCLKYCKENKRFIAGLLNGQVFCYNTDKYEQIREYNVHCAATAVEIYCEGEEATGYIVGTLEGTILALYDYDDKMQLVKTSSLKEDALISSIIVNVKDRICYVTYANNKVIIYTLMDFDMISRYKGITTNCSSITPSLNNDMTLLFIASKEGGIFVFPNMPVISKKSIDIFGVKLNLFVTDGKPIVHVCCIPKTSNILLIDCEGSASIFTLKY